VRGEMNTWPSMEDVATKMCFHGAWVPPMPVPGSGSGGGGGGEMEMDVTEAV
jgi:hypothetical protein